MRTVITDNASQQIFMKDINLSLFIKYIEVKGDMQSSTVFNSCFSFLRLVAFFLV